MKNFLMKYKNSRLVNRLIRSMIRGGVGINALSNLLTRAWSALLNLFSIPLILRYLGPEAFGLVGLYVSFEIIFQFLDLGLSATINREIARNIATNIPGSENKNTLRTFEYFYWPIGLMVALLISSSAGWIVSNWVNIQNLSYQTVKLSIYIMAIMFAARWPMTLYAGAMFGMQKQLQRNIVSVIIATIRITSSIIILIYISQDVTVFLSWQVLFYGIEVFGLMFLVWRELNRASPDKARISTNIIRKVWKFAISFNLIGVLRTVMFSGDRLIASKYVPLSDIGYYSIATTAAGSLNLVSDAIGIAIYPKFAADTARYDYKAVANEFHRYVNLIHYSVFGFCAILIFFPSDILYLWTKDWNVVQNSTLLLIFLAVAYLLNSMGNLCYLLLTASGNTKILLICNIFNVLIFIPALFIFTNRYGIVVVAIILLLENLIAYIVYVYYVGRVFLNGYFDYIVQDIAPYFVGAILWFIAGKLICHFWVYGSIKFAIISFVTIGYYISLAPRIIKRFPVVQKYMSL